MTLSFGGLFVFLFFYLALIVVSIVATARIISKAGYSGLWVLVSFVPFLNVIMFFVFAFSKWPIEARLEAARRSGWYGPGPSPGGPYGGGPQAPPGVPYGGAPVAGYGGSGRAQAPAPYPPASPMDAGRAPGLAPSDVAVKPQPTAQLTVEPLPLPAQPVADVQEVEIPPFRL